MSKQVEKVWFVEFYHPGTDEWVIFDGEDTYARTRGSAEITLSEAREYFGNGDNKRRLRISSFVRS